MLARAIAGLASLLAMLALAGCISVSRSPTVIVPQGATVICPGGSPATLSNGVYQC